MNKTVLFIILLIAPLAFCDSEILAMIDKTPEGKDILDNLFIQMKMMSGAFDVSAVKAFLEQFKASVAEQEKVEREEFEKESAKCEEDKKVFRPLHAKHMERELVVKNAGDRTKRQIERKTSLKATTTEEIENYDKVRTYVLENKKKAEEHYALEGDTLDKIAEVLHTILEILKPDTSKLEAPKAKQVTFVEISSKHQAIFAEVRSNLENLELDSTGAVPIISNLLEILQDPAANIKPEVQVAILAICRDLLEKIRDRKDEVAAELEYISTLFGRLTSTLDANIERGRRVLELNAKIIEELTKQLGSLTDEYKNRVAQRKTFEKLTSYRVEECQKYKKKFEFEHPRIAKVVAIAGELEGVINRQENGFAAYFIQRSMKTN